MNREDAVRCHRHAGVDITLAEALEIYRLAVALDQNDGAGNLAGGDLVIEEGVEALELLGRQLGPRRRPERNRGGRQPDGSDGGGSDHPGKPDGGGPG